MLDRVARGETLTVTLDGRPVAELRPLGGEALPAAVVLERWRRLPEVDTARLRDDLDRVVEASL